jgi:cyclic pyranopterin phosphate synthase
MPKEIFNKDYEFLARDLLLSFDEIERVARAFVGFGVRKIRLTGGEPLLRKGIEDLITKLTQIEGVDDVTLTTNGSLLARKAEALAAAGLDRVTVSLDSMDEAVFMAMNDAGFPVEAVLGGIEAAAAVGLTPVKVNMVVKRGVNDHTIVDMFMDVGTTNGWRLDDVVPSGEVVNAINEVFPLEPVEANYAGEVAERWRYKDGAGEIGVISSVTQPFCATCTRVRLSAEGRIFTCLFAAQGTDLRALLRGGATDVDLASVIEQVWTGRTDRYSEIRTGETTDIPRVEMSYIGG